MNFPGGLRRLLIEEHHGVNAPRLLPLLLAAVALLSLGVLWNPLSPVCVPGAGVLLTVAAARGDRFLLGASLVGFAVRAVAATAFHWVATLDLPALHAALTAPVGGYRFWNFVADSPGYHSSALEAIIAWKQGTEFPSGGGGGAPEYFIVTAIVYRLFGSNPLNAVLWNALFGSLAVVAGYRIAVRVAGPGAARVTAVLIALWPSAIVWSTQLLKDTICLWLILILLYLTMRAVDVPLPAAPRWRALTFWIGILLLLFTAALVMHRFRYYIPLILIPAPAAFVVHALLRRTWQTRWRIFAACVVMAVMVLAVSASRRIDLNRVFGYPYPEIGHVNLGVMYQARGDLDSAKAHYEWALNLKRDYPPALKKLGAIAIARHDRTKAIDYLERYLVYEPRDAEARAARDALLGSSTMVAAIAPTAMVPYQSESVPLPVVDPAPIPVPPRPLAITGSRSDYATGGRASEYGDVFGVIKRMRMGFALSGGNSQIDTNVQFNDYRDMLRYVPRAVTNVFFSPYPSQWFDIGGSTGAFKALSVIEVVLLYVLVGPLIIGLGMVVVRGSPDALYLAAFVVAITVLLGLVVSNVGTLFRLRLESLLPLFAAGGLGCAWFLHRR